MADQIGTVVEENGVLRFRCDASKPPVVVDIPEKVKQGLGWPLQAGERYVYKLKRKGNDLYLNRLEHIPDGDEVEGFQPGRSQPATGHEQGFVNPYHFVPLGPHPPARGRPASHERFSGYSGTVTCRLILHSPFFLPDPERRSEMEGHERLHLFTRRDEDGQERALIPGSALKGAIGSVLEALSNSCLRIVDLEDRPSKRIDPEELNDWRKARRWGCGIVRREATPDSPGLLAPCEIGRVPFRRPWKSGWDPGDLVDDRRDGDEVWVEVDRYQRTWKLEDQQEPTLMLGRLKVTDVPDAGDPETRSPGWYQHVKKRQRVFYDEKPESEWLGFSYEVQQAYNIAHEAGRERDARSDRFTVERNGERLAWAMAAEDSEFGGAPGGGLRPRRHRLREGDLVYYVLRENLPKQDRKTDAIEILGAAEVLRKLLPRAVADGTPEEFRPCSQPDCLCPACRLLGWIPPERRVRKREEEEARAGFIRFGTALSEPLRPGNVHSSVTLAPLGQPHISAAPFYLEPRPSGEAATYADSSVSIRGRKFYWHQEPRGQWVDARSNGSPQRDRQNRTVDLLWRDEQGWVPTFAFTVEFDNLSAADLGLLLLALQPNLLGPGNVPSGCLYHHIGMGKPLGLGSAQVVITELTLIDRAQRYRDLDASGMASHAGDGVRAAADPFVDAFVRQALEDQGLVPDGDRIRLQFASLPPITALLLLLDWQHKPQGVRYPPGPDGAPQESFRWFMDVNQPLLTVEELAREGKRQTG